MAPWAFAQTSPTLLPAHCNVDMLIKLIIHFHSIVLIKNTTLVNDKSRNNSQVKTNNKVIIYRRSNIYFFQLTNTQAPWGLILKSVAFWALCVLNFGYAWIIISLCIHGPLYYTQVLKYTLYQVSIHIK